MKKNILRLFLFVFLMLSLNACGYRYSSNTHEKTDSYGSVFQGKRVPQDVR